MKLNPDSHTTQRLLYHPICHGGLCKITDHCDAVLKSAIGPKYFAKVLDERDACLAFLADNPEELIRVIKEYKKGKKGIKAAE